MAGFDRRGIFRQAAAREARRVIPPAGSIPLVAGPDLDTLTENDNLSIAGVAADAQDVFLDSTGINCIIVSDDPDRTLAAFTFSTPFDITTLGAVDTELTPAARSFAVTAKDDGTKVYIGNLSGDIVEYTLGTPWDFSTASVTHTFDFSIVADSSDLCLALHLKEDGTRMLIGGNGTLVHSITLSTPWDLSTASYDDSIDITAETTFNYGVAMDALGTKMYVADLTSQNIFQYTLSVAWDVTSAVYASKSVVGIVAGAVGIHFDGVNNNGQLIQVSNATVKLIGDFT